jgi:hypothetical protein
MGEMLRNFGISESGIEGPALYGVMAGLACIIVRAQLRNRAPGTSAMMLVTFYLGAITTGVATMWFVFQIENENVRYVLALVCIGALIFGARALGRRYLGTRPEDADEPSQTSSG